MWYNTFHHVPRHCRRGGLSLSRALNSYFVFVIYRPPSSGCHAMPFRLFLDEFNHLLEHVSIKQTGVMILGDFNSSLRKRR